MRALPCLVALGAAAAAASCTPMTPVAIEPAVPPALAAHCDAKPAAVLHGQQATSETGDRALALTGARTLRWGPPGAVFTMDYRTDRVNVMYDAAMAITEIRCG